MLKTAMTKGEVTETVTAAVAEVMAARGLDAAALAPGAKLADTLGLKSMDLAEIVMTLEDTFEVDPFQTIPITSVRTVADLGQAYLVTLGLAEAAPAADMADEMAAARARRGGRRR